MQPLAFPWPSTLRNTTCLPSRRWLQSSKPEDPEAFDGSPDDPQPLFPTCLPGACPMLNNEQQTFFYDFHNMVLEVILRKGPGPNACAQEPLPLQFKSAFCPVEPCVVVAYHARKKPIEVALVNLEPVFVEDAGSHILFILALAASTEGYFPFQDDVEFLAALARRAIDWTVSVSILSAGPARQLCHFDILGVCQSQIFKVKSSEKLHSKRLCKL